MLCELILSILHATFRFGPRPFYVTFGSNSLSIERFSIKTKAVYKHPNYTGSFENNIALIKLEEDIKFNENVKPVKLPKTASDQIGNFVTIAGWGPYNTGVCIPKLITIYR